MRTTIVQSYFIGTLDLLSFSGFAQEAKLIPMPVRTEVKQGHFRIDKATTLVFSGSSKDLKSAANFFSTAIQTLSGINLPFLTKAGKTIVLKLAKTAEIGSECYLLNVTPAAITITANTKAAGFVASQKSFYWTPADQ